MLSGGRAMGYDSSMGEVGVRTAAEIKVAFRSAKVAALRTANGAEATLNDSAVLSGWSE
jgi:hypothetical protein